MQNKSKFIIISERKYLRPQAKGSANRGCLFSFQPAFFPFCLEVSEKTHNSDHFLLMLLMYWSSPNMEPANRNDWAT